MITNVGTMKVTVHTEDLTDWGIGTVHTVQCQMGKCRAIAPGDTKEDMLRWFANEHVHPVR